ITAVAARWNKNRDYIIEGFCRVRSKGFRKGMVADAAMATDSIREALKKLKERTGKKIQDVYAGISSTSIKVIPSSGVLLLSKYGREVSEGDIKKCMQIGSTIKIPLDKEPLHRIVRGFSVDEDEEIKNPLNLEGVKLGVDMNILMINSSTLRNMSKCISHAGFIPAGFVFSGLAAAYRVLTEEDRQTGIVLMDMRKDLTEIMVFCRGTLTSCKVFPVGTNDLLSKDGSINLDSLEKTLPQIVSLSGWDKARKAMVIGEGARMDNLTESLEGLLGLSVTVGTCIVKPFEELPPERTGYIGSLGILDYLQQENQRQRLESNIIKKILNSILTFLNHYF
ncbi:hypothetical protein ACFL5Y_03615, partial [Candidatus Omnitrophota bacterium]